MRYFGVYFAGEAEPGALFLSESDAELWASEKMQARTLMPGTSRLPHFDIRVLELGELPLATA